MKKLTMSFVALLLFATACQKHANQNEPDEIVSAIGERKCASHEILEQQMAEDPARARAMQELERFTQQYVQNQEARKNRANATINIPVVVHMVYNTDAQKLDVAQIQSQIDVLNEDFNLRNSDANLVNQNPDFAAVQSNVGITFTLSEIVWKKTSKKSFGTDDGVKYTRRGGSDAVDPTNKLNVWVCNLGQNLLGYAQFPGGNPATDGIVVLYSAFGSIKKYPSGTYVGNYDLGRTATHEVGHWLNLRHIWGDATCGNDFVDDTPVHNTSNTGCKDYSHRSTCAGTPLEMWMNYMDYTYDKCMYMFTNDQSARMHAVFAAGRPRASFAN